jgi:hypothetical protein
VYNSEEVSLKQYMRYDVCGFLALGEDVKVTIVGDVATYLYTDCHYNSSTDLDAVVNGTMIETDDGITVDTALNLVFSNDDMGLQTMGGNNNRRNYH